MLVDRMKALAWSLLTLAAGFAPADEPANIGFSVLAGFEYQEGKALPDTVTKYDGKKVTVAGFMKREDGGDGDAEEFLIVNDACGCNGTPKLNEIVFCVMPAGEMAKIKAGVAKVTGTLHVGEEKDGDTVVALYVLDVESTGQ